MSERANRVSVQAVGEEGFEARFFRTHTQVGSVMSTQSFEQDGEQVGFQPDPKDNKTAQREAFRKWVCEHADRFGIAWDPTDRRSTDNKRAPKYDTDETLRVDVVALVTDDIRGFVDGCKIEGLTLVGIDAEDIVPMTTSPKGADLSKLGVLDGKYANGNWAWATISVVATVKLDKVETYVSMKCTLVSGQLKKPTAIDNGGFNQTAFKAAVTADIKVEESKPEEQPTEEPKKSKKKGEAKA
jgi:hypothetical protein